MYPDTFSCLFIFVRFVSHEKTRTLLHNFNLCYCCHYDLYTFSSFSITVIFSYPFSSFSTTPSHSCGVNLCSRICFGYYDEDCYGMNMLCYVYDEDTNHIKLEYSAFTFRPLAEKCALDTGFKSINSDEKLKNSKY